MQYGPLEKSFYFGFAVNNTAGSGEDGASATFAVRKYGVAASAAPVITGTATLLTHASFSNGSYEIIVPAQAASGFIQGGCYGVFSTLLMSGQNPVGHVGDFELNGVMTGIPSIEARYAYGITEAGVPSAVTPTSVTLETGHIFGLNALRGATVFVEGSAQGYFQVANILSNTSANPCVLTLADPWAITPTGVYRNVIFGTSGSSLTNLPTVNVTQMGGQAVTAAAGITVPALIASTTNITAGTVAGVTGLTASDIAVIKAKTDQLNFTASNKVHADIKAVNSATVTGNGTTGNEWGP